MNDIISQLLEGGVIAVIRASSPEEAEKLSIAAAKGGIKGLEVTFTVPGAENIIRHLSASNVDALVGAGTVLDPETARLAVANGAKFIVSPAFDKVTSDTCKELGVPYIPGCFTPTEILRAHNEGAELIKIFPGSALSPSYLKALHGPFPHIRLMPTGGVSVENAKEWIHSGAVAIGTGSNLTAPAKRGDYEEVTRLAKAFVEEVAKARKELSK